MSGKEVFLSQEISSLQESISTFKKRITELKEKNACLKREEAKIRVENQEHSLYNHTCHDIKSGFISEEYKAHADAFKEQLNSIVTNHNTLLKAKESDLHKKIVTLQSVINQISSLEALQILKQRQMTNLEELENEWKIIKKQNMEELHSFRTSLKIEKTRLESLCNSKVNEVAENSKKNARICIREEVGQILESNEKLKNELLVLMKKQATLEENIILLNHTKMRLSANNV